MSILLEWLATSERFFLDLGIWGVLLFAGIIVVAQFILAPLAPVAITGGLIFGLGRGYLAITLGTALGAMLNYLVSRYVARRAVSRFLERNEKFRLIDSAIGREGWRIIALLRFCPIPFGFSNYAYGLTAIRFWPYFLATIFAIIPGNLFFTWLGATAKTGLQAAVGAGRPRHPMEYVLMGVGLCASFVAMLYITKVARTALAKTEAAQQVKEA